MEVLFYKKDWI